MMKVQDLARELGQHTKDFIRTLREIDVRAKSGNTKLDPETVTIVRDLFKEKAAEAAEAKEVEDERNRYMTLDVNSITVGELIERLEVSTADMMRAILSKGLLLNLNSEVDQNTATEIATELKIDLDFDTEDVAPETSTALKDRLTEMENHQQEHSKNLITRPPIITIMGHVDHGKTKLLDTIRSSNVVAKEAGGITQHIGAYQVTHNGQKLTFLDTPGHAAFTSLRARGAQITDIAILVVAADDGVMPQTLEALSHAKAANVPIIVAINKMDKPESDPDRIKQQLSQHNLVSEDWGGNTQMVPISALKGDGLDNLLEIITLNAELLELTADPTSLAKSVVIESNLSQKRGPVATVIIKSGTLKVGDHFVVGNKYGKIRAMFNDLGESVREALPGAPVEILGISEVPSPGDILEVYENEKAAKAAQSNVAERVQSASLRTVSLETLSQQIEEGSIRKLNLVIKADVNGSLEAIISSIEQIPTDEVSIHTLHANTGSITENDVSLAAASNAFIISFGVAVPPEVKHMAEEAGITIKEYSVIYEIIDDVKRAVEGMFKVEYEESQLGEAEVREMFKFSKVGVIAGCNIQSGMIRRGESARVRRDGEVEFEGKVDSLKRFKEDVREVTQGYECGIVLDGFDKFKEGDIIECFQLVEKKKTL